MYKMNEIQKEVLCSTKHITLISNGRCQGATEATIFKVLCTGGTNLFIVPRVSDATHLHDMVMDVCKRLAVTVTYKTKGHFGQGVYIDTERGDINIQTAKEAEQSLWMKINVDRVYVDRPELMPKTVDLLLTQKECYEQITFTTNPIECGWRDPLFTRGLPDFDNNGNMITDKRSWDYDLINWKPFKHNTRASKEDYKNFVHVINIPTQDNYLDDDFLPYNEEQSLYLEGDWITGAEIKI